MVTAIAEGTSIITASAGGKSGTCTITVSKKVVEVSSIELNKTSASLKAGETVTLTATVKPDDATDKTVTWTTSDASVATVDNGVVTAKKVGSATITAKAGDKSATCAITVVATPVTSVTLNKTSAQLKAGETVTLTATVKPDDATDKTVTWTTSNASAATVDNGVVTAKKVGSATITAQAGDKSANCSITVVTTPVSSVTLNKTSAYLEAGETVTLTATVKPDDADKTVTWSTSDANVATVDNGVVTAKKFGSAYITAKAEDKTANCSITVPKPNLSVELNIPLHSMEVGDTQTITASLLPEGAREYYSSADYVYFVFSKADELNTPAESLMEMMEITRDTPDCAGVWRWKLTAKKIGSLRVTVWQKELNYYEWLDYSECIKIPTAVKSLSLNHSSISLWEGESFDLIASVLPEDAEDGTVTWYSDNTNVATVSNGRVTAVSYGETKIHASAGNKLASCTVTVKYEAADLGLSVLWARNNLSSTGFDNYGGKYHFAWGEINPGSNFDWTNYTRLSDGSKFSLKRYNYSPSYGVVDNKFSFADYDYEDDAARQILGGEWRVPTRAEWQELKSQCSFEYLGYSVRITGPNGNSITLPFDGYESGGTNKDDNKCGYYWSSELHYTTDPDFSSGNLPTRASYYRFSKNLGNSNTTLERCHGLSIRPVISK